MLPAVLLLAGLFLLFHTTPGAPTAGKPITCEAGAFHIGEPASIDCNFRTNITASKRDISITWYTSEVDRGKDVLWCHWSVETKKHVCKIEMANYTFDGVFTEHLTIKIPAVTTEHGGWYKCFFIASDEIKAHPCELRLQAELISAKTGKNLLM
ncbi:uncharacterized protein [Littorina saxatilis]|uniref:Ig-like domain-containing protein n=1 Tax=Littorina saxatilis TaxID=31220 RepID=A0AAN9BI10_9CAEN